MLLSKNSKQINAGGGALFQLEVLKENWKERNMNIKA